MTVDNNINHQIDHGHGHGSVRRSLAACAIVVVSSWASAALAAEADTPARAANADDQRAACMNGTSQEDKATCLKEAGAAMQERKAGKLQATPSDAATLQQNALQRCTNLPLKDRPDCESRAKGQGLKEGSVNGGGMIKETVTTKVLPAGSTVPAGSTQIGTLPGAAVPAPPSFASAPQ